MSTPPVSISRKRLPDHSHTSSLRSRVVPLVSWTTAARELVSRLTSVDLPTFGNPTIATVPIRGALTALAFGAPMSRQVERLPQVSNQTRRVACRSYRWGLAARAAPRVHVGEPAEEDVDAALDLRGRLLVATPALRQPLEQHGLPHRDRAGREVARFPELRPVDGRGDHWHVFLQRDHRRPRLRLTWPPRALPRPLDEEPDHPPVARRLA